MKQKDVALKKFLKSKLNTDHLKYKQLRNKVTSQLRNAKANFYLNMIKDSKGNSKLWKTMDKLLGRGKTCTDQLQLKINGVIIHESFEIAENFNNYFLNSVQELAGTFINSICASIFDCDETFFKLNYIAEGSVSKYILYLNKSKTKDIFGIDTAFLKEYNHILAPVLTKVINQSISESTFPSVLKTAVVRPIHKSGDKLQVSNYRPISILPSISKVLEKVVAEQLTEHLDAMEALHPLQFGFRKKYSTETACCYLLEDIKSRLDGGGVVGAVFLDLRKAFSTLIMKFY